MLNDSGRHDLGKFFMKCSWEGAAARLSSFER